MAKTDGLVNEEFFEYADYIGHKIARLNDLLDAHVNIPNTIHNFQEYLGRLQSKLWRLQGRLRDKFGSEANETKMCTEALELLGHASVEIMSATSTVDKLAQFCEDELADCRDEEIEINDHMSANYPDKAPKTSPKKDDLDKSKFISSSPMTF